LLPLLQHGYLALRHADVWLQLQLHVSLFYHPHCSIPCGLLLLLMLLLQLRPVAECSCYVHSVHHAVFVLL